MRLTFFTTNAGKAAELRGLLAPAGVAVEQDARGYPEPQRQGIMPAYGFFIRHAKGIQMDNVEVSYTEPEARPPFVFDATEQHEKEEEP